ncbi:uncharacterized protein LOC122861117 [Aphidius gifuensis]|uniref:uncharacterized protein LOC122861117 n=1 Tax=Aphidius gifuensis TaxID=684658 RepID=UPI001CDBB42B|nr:uncharacterized protein LOC122861117 [Aphidius gifuensis]
MSRRQSTSKQRIRKIKINYLPDNIQEIAEEIETLKTHIDILNDDCLPEIFMNSTMEDRLQEKHGDCTQKKNACQNNWNDIHGIDFTYKCPQHCDNKILLTELEEKKTYDVDHALKQCGKSLENLKLGNIPDARILMIIHDYCHNLIKLDLDLINYEEKYFEKFFENMKNLKHLEIKKPGYFTKNFVQELHLLPATMEEIHLYCSKSPATNFDYSCTASAETWKNTLKKFNCLRALTLYNYTIDAKIMKGIIQKKTITNLNLSLSKFERCNHMITRLVNLEKLEFQFSDQVNDALLRLLSSECKNLKYLNLTWCQKVTDIGIKDLSKLEKLDELIVCGISSKDFTGKTINQFSKLKKFDCRCCNRIGDNSIISLLRNSTCLEKLNVRSTSISVRTLISATSITNNRKNNIVLTLRVGRRDKFDFNDKQWISPFLNIEYDE